ncbi:MAG: flagellar brake protein [bacterium]|nr:flagellar brake protein [bacterium]
MADDINIEILYKAVEENINIVMGHSERDKDAFNFSSRFLEYNLEEKTITIDFPSTTQDVEKLRRRDFVVIYFIYKNSRFVFHSRVLKLTKYQLPDGRKIKGMLIMLPEFIGDGERRNFFKVATPPFVVDIRILEKKETDELPHVSEDGSLLETDFKATAINVSGGGIAFKGQEEDLPFQYGDILYLKIHFLGETLLMEGRVVNKYQFENSEQMIFGIEFIQKDIDMLRFKKNVKNLMHYVMKRERELLLSR